jgi:hypothetical protein
MSLEPGQMLSRYRLLAKIGEGGMGVVWKALDTSLDREVAIKLLPDELSQDAERLARLESEARIVAALNHPNIVTLHSIEEAEGRRFLTLELVEGRPLAELIPSRGFALPEFARIAHAVVEALSAAHRRGITHRDIKPRNIMVGKDSVKVLDFGLAQSPKAPSPAAVPGKSDQPTRTQVGDDRVVGSLAYMSPECVEGLPVDVRSDLFSLGAVLYEMATGRRPFLGDSAMGIISAVLKDTPAPLGELRPERVRELGPVVARCLVKEPAGRYPSARALADELAALRPGFVGGAQAARAAVEPSPGAGGAAAVSARSSLARLQQRWTAAAPLVLRALQIDPSIEPTVAPEKRKSVPVGALLGLFLPGIGLVYAAPVLTALVVLVCGAIPAGLLEGVPVVGGLLSGLAWLVLALVSSVLGGTYVWHYNRHGKRTALRALRYGR